MRNRRGVRYLARDDAPERVERCTIRQRTRIIEDAGRDGSVQAYRGLPGMSALASLLAGDTSVTTEFQVKSLQRGPPLS